MRCGELDLIGSVVKTVQFDRNEQKLFVLNLMGAKRGLISTKVVQNEYIIHYNYKTMRQGTVSFLKHRKYIAYDNNLSLHSTHSYRRLEFISNAHKNKELKRAKEFVLSQDGQNEIQSVMEHIETNMIASA